MKGQEEEEGVQGQVMRVRAVAPQMPSRPSQWPLSSSSARAVDPSIQSAVGGKRR